MMNVKRAALGAALAVALAPCGFAETAPAHKGEVMAQDRLVPLTTRQDYNFGGEFNPGSRSFTPPYTPPLVPDIEGAAKSARERLAYTNERKGFYGVELYPDQYEYLDRVLAAQYPDDPQKQQDAAYRLATSFRIQERYGVDAAEAAANYDMYRRALIDTPHAEFNPKSAFEAITGQLHIGLSMWERNEYINTYRAAMDAGDKELASKMETAIRDLENRNALYQDYQPRWVTTEALKLGASIITTPLGGATAVVIAAAVLLTARARRTRRAKISRLSS